MSEPDVGNDTAAVGFLDYDIDEDNEYEAVIHRSTVDTISSSRPAKQYVNAVLSRNRRLATFLEESLAINQPNRAVNAAVDSSETVSRTVKLGALCRAQTAHAFVTTVARRRYHALCRLAAAVESATDAAHACIAAGVVPGALAAVQPALPPRRTDSASSGAVRSRPGSRGPRHRASIGGQQSVESFLRDANAARASQPLGVLSRENLESHTVAAAAAAVEAARASDSVLRPPPASGSAARGDDASKSDLSDDAAVLRRSRPDSTASGAPSGNSDASAPDSDLDDGGAVPLPVLASAMGSIRIAVGVHVPFKRVELTAHATPQRPATTVRAADADAVARAARRSDAEAERLAARDPMAIAPLAAPPSALVVRASATSARQAVAQLTAALHAMVRSVHTVRTATVALVTAVARWRATPAGRGPDGLPLSFLIGREPYVRRLMQDPLAFHRTVLAALITLDDNPLFLPPKALVDGHIYRSVVRPAVHALVSHFTEPTRRKRHKSKANHSHASAAGSAGHRPPSAAMDATEHHARPAVAGQHHGTALGGTRVRDPSSVPPSPAATATAAAFHGGARANLPIGRPLNSGTVLSADSSARSPAEAFAPESPPATTAAKPIVFRPLLRHTAPLPAVAANSMRGAARTALMTAVGGADGQTPPRALTAARGPVGRPVLHPISKTAYIGSRTVVAAGVALAGAYMFGAASGRVSKEEAELLTAPTSSAQSLASPMSSPGRNARSLAPPVVNNGHLAVGPSSPSAAHPTRAPQPLAAPRRSGAAALMDRYFGTGGAARGLPAVVPHGGGSPPHGGGRLGVPPTPSRSPASGSSLPLGTAGSAAGPAPSQTSAAAVTAAAPALGPIAFPSDPAAYVTTNRLLVDELRLALAPVGDDSAETSAIGLPSVRDMANDCQLRGLLTMIGLVRPLGRNASNPSALAATAAALNDPWVKAITRGHRRGGSAVAAVVGRSVDDDDDEHSLSPTSTARATRGDGPKRPPRAGGNTQPTHLSWSVLRRTEALLYIEEILPQLVYSAERENAAAVLLQKHVRRWLLRRRFLSLSKEAMTPAAKAHARALLAQARAQPRLRGDDPVVAMYAAEFEDADGSAALARTNVGFGSISVAELLRGGAEVDDGDVDDDDMDLDMV